MTGSADGDILAKARRDACVAKLIVVFKISDWGLRRFPGTIIASKKVRKMKNAPRLR
jgi:hypothetical protein